MLVVGQQKLPCIKEPSKIASIVETPKGVFDMFPNIDCLKPLNMIFFTSITNSKFLNILNKYYSFYPP